MRPAPELTFMESRDVRRTRTGAMNRWKSPETKIKTMVRSERS